LFAVLAADDRLCVWSGLGLREVLREGERLFERVGHFLLTAFPQRRSWRDDLRPLLKQDKRVFTLV
jgi:hypothetical protein